MGEHGEPIMEYVRPELPPEELPGVGKLMQKTREAMQMVAAGVDPRKALMITNGGKSVNRETVRRLKHKVEKWHITHANAQKTAHKSLIALAGGHDINGIKPRAADIRAAAERIIDQIDPVTRRSESVAVRVDCPVDLSRYALPR